jgi:replicative DNA helicase
LTPAVRNLLSTRSDLNAGADNVKTLASALEEQTKRRRLHQLGQRLTAAAHHVDTSTLLKDAALEVTALSSSNLHTPQDYDGQAMATRILERQKERAANPTLIRGIKTGYPMFDALTGGLQTKNVSAITGLPGAKKSTLALNILANASLALDDRPMEAAVPGLYVSLELMPETGEDRLHAIITNSPLNLITRGDFDGQEAATVLRNGLLAITTDAPKTISDVIALLRKHKMMRGIKLAAVDYFQNISEDRDDTAKEYQNQKRWVRALEATAKELDIHIIIVSQSNRDQESNEPSRRFVSGTYHLIYTTSYYLILTSPNGAQDGDIQSLSLILDKCRFCSYPATFPLEFNEKTQRITQGVK